MDVSLVSTNGEHPVIPKNGTVEDVRPIPPIDPKAQNPQAGHLKDSTTHERKSFIANLSSPLYVNDDVFYVDLPEPASHDAQVTGKRQN